MILYRWQGLAPNFGDELNTLLWPALLPGFFDDVPDTHFLGIGSVLDSRHSAGVRKLVAGSGFGGYEQEPRLDSSWTIHWVRGPRTASVLGLPANLAQGDPALLLPLALKLPPAGPNPTDIGFMPHFETLGRGAWPLAAALAGVTLIDPREPPLQVIAAIRRCRVLLTEALHGVIAADALRVPWVAIRPLASIHRAKWADWSEMMAVTTRPVGLPASSVAEWVDVRAAAAPRRLRLWLDRQHRHLRGIRSSQLLTGAAEGLRRAALAEPQLSPAAALDRCQSRMMDTLDALRRRPVSQAAGYTPVRGARSGLRALDDSAYELKPVG